MIIQSLIVYQPVKLGHIIRNSFHVNDGFILEYHKDFISIKKDDMLTCVGMSNVAQFTPVSLQIKEVNSGNKKQSKV